MEGENEALKGENVVLRKYMTEQIPYSLGAERVVRARPSEGRMAAN